MLQLYHARAAAAPAVDAVWLAHSPNILTCIGADVSLKVGHPGSDQVGSDLGQLSSLMLQLYHELQQRQLWTLFEAPLTWYTGWPQKSKPRVAGCNFVNSWSIFNQISLPES